MARVTMNTELVVTLIILGVVWGEAQSCDSCGSECASACGTRNFRTCCFNYLRKRSEPPESFPPALDPSLRLELWLAKSRYPYVPRKMIEDSLEMPNGVKFSGDRDSSRN